MMKERSARQLVLDVLAQLGIKQKQLAMMLGISQATVSHWVTGKATPSSDQGAMLTELLGRTEERRTLAQWVTEKRNERGWTVADLAREAELSLPAVYNIESGRITNPRERTRKALERALGAQLAVAIEREMTASSGIPGTGVGPFTDFDPYVEDELPVVAGVYVFYDISDRPIYVGKSENIGKRVKTYSEKFWFRKPIVEKAAYVQVEDENLRAQIEVILIRFLKSNAVLNKMNVDR